MKWNRRDFLKNTSAATLAAMAAGAPLTSLLTSCNRKKINSKADSVILLWMAGGMAHTDTFDPKNTLLLQKEWTQTAYLVHLNRCLLY